jgi:hypothetical protein
MLKHPKSVHMFFSRHICYAILIIRATPLFIMISDYNIY